LLKAQGAASRIIEDGKATAEAVELMRKQWENGETQELFMIRMFPELLDRVTRVVADNLRIEKLTILDGGDGEGLPTHIKNLTKSAVVMLEQMKNATGVDLAKLATKTNGAPKADIPKELD
jgi:flotillin